MKREKSETRLVRVNKIDVRTLDNGVQSFFSFFLFLIKKVSNQIVHYLRMNAAGFELNYVSRVNFAWNLYAYVTPRFYCIANNNSICSCGSNLSRISKFYYRQFIRNEGSKISRTSTSLIKETREKCECDRNWILATV